MERFTIIEEPVCYKCKQKDEEILHLKRLNQELITKVDKLRKLTIDAGITSKIFKVKQVKIKNILEFRRK